MELTFVAARVGGASGSIALSGVSAVHGSVVVGACVVRAECFAALFFFALTAIALHVAGVLDRSVAVGSADEVAVRRVCVVVGAVTRCPKGNDKQLGKHELDVFQYKTEWVSHLKGTEGVS